MEQVSIIYIGPKPFKKDTVTGSRTLFPKDKPVSVASDIAYRLLAHPLVWIKESDLKSHQEDLERLDNEALARQRSLAEAAELDRQRRDMNCGDFGDIGKLTAAQLKTLIEGAELDVPPQAAQEKVDDFRLRVRDALRAKIVADQEQQ